LRGSDFPVRWLRSGGKGGQNQNKRDTGVRVLHHPSGARGESREERGQLENKKLAFKRMGESDAFQTWAKIKALALPSIDSIVDNDMVEDNLVIEGRESGKWTFLG
jgi:protein subunit release factor A